MNSELTISGFESAILCLNDKIRRSISLIPLQIKEKAQEIRIRVNKNVLIVCPENSYFLSHDGNVSQKETLLFVEPMDISETIKAICSYSIYSYQNQIKNGFITLRGGHRAGICGTAVINGSEITNIRDISSINIRIAKEVKNCSKQIIRRLGSNISRTIIAGPPSSGKTTFLRDISRKLSIGEYGNPKKVSIIDERGEIAAVYRGVPQCDIGMCDVLNSYPKGIGIMQAIRALSPDIIICDEIGSGSEIPMIEEGLNSGVGIIASIHVGSIDELSNKKQIITLLKTHAFKKIILLNSKSKYTGNFEIINSEEIC